MNALVVYFVMEREGPLYEGELERAAEWARFLIEKTNGRLQSGRSQRQAAWSTPVSGRSSMSNSISYLTPARTMAMALTIVILMACSTQKSILHEEGQSLAIHLVSGLSVPRGVDQSDLGSIELQSPPLIQDDDIVHYDLETHEIELTGEAFDRVMDLFKLPVDTDGIPFMVVVSGEPIYSGAFYTPASSISYNGVVILQPLSGKPRTISLVLGYPTVEAFEGEDPRSDPRIINALRELGKINQA